VRPDRFTRGLEGLRAGEAVTLVDEDGRDYGTALADPEAEVCARVFHRKAGAVFDPAAAIVRAWERRASLHADPDTDCYRLVHGEADFLPGLRVERYASVLVVVALAPCIVPSLDAVCAALHGLRPEATIVVREHLDDLRRAEVATRLWRPEGSSAVGVPDADTVVIGKELGCRYPLRPCAGLATGLYVDQRATRAWLRPLAKGKRVLNLFAYTGAFSVSLLAAGAAAATDVDLSAPALARAVEAAALNEVAERHRAVTADCRKFLAASRDDFDLVIIDPPTAAQGGDGWVARRDYPDLLRLAWARLAPGGLLVACVNTVGGKSFALDEALAQAARQAGVRMAPVVAPGPAVDVPQLKGFPEGRPFRLAAARRD
jgi:23S rRNA (cytosine1962-C5)-methyltransferase